MNGSSTTVRTPLSVGGLLLACALCCAAGIVMAQPISTGVNPYRAHTVSDTGGLAIGGYDPVAYFVEGRAVEGHEDLEFLYKGARWHFSSAENLDAFADDPESYLPEYGGFCTVCMVEQEGLFDANPKMWTIVDGKLYLNYDSRTRSRFRVNRDTYIPWADRVWAKLTKSEGIQKETIEESLRQAATQQQPETTLGASSTRTPSEPYKVAIFPLDSSRHNLAAAAQVESHVSDSISSYLQRHHSLEATYSYYAAQSGASGIERKQVWTRTPASREPNVKAITEMGNKLGVQAVTLAWYKPATNMPDVHTSQVGLYVIDVERGKTYRVDGTGRDVQTMLGQVFSDFLAGREAPTYKIAIFPPHTNRQGYTLAGPTEREVMQQLRSSLQGDVSLQTTYDYAAAPSGAPAIRPNQVWTRSTEPKAESVITLAKQLGVDGVVAAFHRPADVGREGNWERGTVAIFVFDVTQGTVYKQTGLAGEVENLAQAAFSDFIAAQSRALTE